MGLLLTAFGWVLEWVRRIRVRAHRAAFFRGTEDAATSVRTMSAQRLPCLFINVTNLSPRREVEITHVWVATEPQVQVLNPSRPLPARLRLDESWETWIELSRLPAVPDELEHLARIRLSNGKVLKSRRGDPPPAGFVPGGLSRAPDGIPLRLPPES